MDLFEDWKLRVIGFAIIFLLTGGYVYINGPQIFNTQYSISVEGELRKGWPDGTSNALDPEPISEIYVAVAAEGGCKEGKKLGSVTQRLEDGNSVEIEYIADKADIQDQQPGVDLDPHFVKFCVLAKDSGQIYESWHTYNYQDLNSSVRSDEVIKMDDEDGDRWTIELKKFRMAPAVVY